MKKGLILLAAAVSGLAVISSAQAQYAPIGTAYPAIHDDTGPGVVIDYLGGTSFTITATGQGPYDGSDDAYVAIENHSSVPLPSVTLTASGPIFGFDGDGIDVYGSFGSGNGVDTSGYGGHETYYTGINSSKTSGTANFIGGLPAGDETYFSLEENLSGVNGGSPGGGLTGSVPDSFSSMALLSGALTGIAGLRRRFSK